MAAGNGAAMRAAALSFHLDPADDQQRRTFAMSAASRIIATRRTLVRWRS
jgi:hypothetical protein